ncbi:MAG TPA: peptidase [Acidimicrobiia bacterium]|nr:peptidase [Acidimicrobiia bacterium]
MKRALTIFSLAVAVAAGWSASSPPANAGRPVDARSYWTSERIADAKPRDIVVDHKPEFAQPQARPDGAGGGNGGGGNGGGETGSTTGSSWGGNEFVRRTTGKVFFTLGSTNYVCSGSTVDDANADVSLVLTAGHCVEGGADGAFASKFVYIPDFERWATKSCTTDPGRCFAASRLVTTSAWAEDGDLNYDVAFAVINGNTLESTWASQAIGFNLDRNQSTYAFGYPAAGKYKGTKLIYCAGTTRPDPYGSFDQGLGCGMTGGSSGGAWYVDFDPTTARGMANSVNSFKYYIDNSTMYGPYFGNYAQATYEAARVGGTENTAVSAPALVP